MKELQILSENGKSSQKYKGKIRVVETYSYRFVLKENGTIIDGELVLEGVINDDSSIRKIKLNSLVATPFINCLGYFSLSFDGTEVAELDIITIKINSESAHYMFEYVYSNAQNIFDFFLNKQRQFDSSYMQNKDMSLLSYISVIKELLTVYSNNFSLITNRPVYKLNKQREINDYDEKRIAKSGIEWILNNLDELQYNVSLKGYPKSFPIENTYATIDRLEMENEVINLNVYENMIIIGALFSLGKKINQISEHLQSILSQDVSLDTNFASFESIRRTIFKSELEALYKVKSKYLYVRRLYKSYFKNVTPLELSPKLTHHFKKKRHYNEIYQKIKTLRNSNLSISGANMVLGIKNIDKLYELYNLYKIIELFQIYTGDPIDIELNDDNDLQYISFSKSEKTYRIYYQLEIRKKDSKPQYGWIKLFSNSSINQYYIPDIVIEIVENETQCYAILDAKFSSAKWVSGSTKSVGETAQKIIGKYYFSISFLGEKYKKGRLSVLIISLREYSKDLNKRTWILSYHRSNSFNAKI